MRRLVALPIVAAASALIWSSLGSVNVASGQEDPAIIARAHEASFAPSFDKPIFVLLLGGDAHRGNPERVRMDSIHILGIDPVQRKAAILGIPRDSFVEIPGRGKGKITGAGRTGGPDLTIRTVERLSGCVFNYYTLTSFQNFVSLVDQFGGLTFDVKQRLFEARSSKINLFPGKQVLNGKQSLAYARFRYGRPRGDFDRSFAQGELMVAALEEARADVGRNPGAALRALGALRRNLRMDIPLDEAIKLGLLMLRIKPQDVKNLVLDGSGATTEGGSSIVEISESGRDQLVDICGDGLLEKS